MEKKTEKLLAELQRQRQQKAEAPKFVLEEHCFDKQLLFITDPAKFKTAYCSRRAGKTEACAADLFHTALNRPNTNSLYITLSRKSAKRIIWRCLLQLDRKYKTNAKVDNVELTLEFPNGSMIYCSGAKDLAEIDKFRGMALVKVYIDEAQSFKPYLRELIDDVIGPALYDYDGSLALIGTPNAACAGVFFDACHQRHGFRGWKNHHWTIYDNPWIERKSGKTVEAILNQVLIDKGITRDDPTFQRESLGVWKYDGNALMYPGFEPKRNVYEKLPEGKEYHYVLGCDIGWTDADALAVVAFSKDSPQAYLVEELVSNKNDITDFVNQVKYLEKKYTFTKKVMDAGALGKKIQEEIRQRHGLHLEAADKHRKTEYIELLNDDLRTGKFLVERGMIVIEDWRNLQWDKSNPFKWKEDSSFHSDIADAVLYAWREAKHFGYEAQQQKHGRNTDAYAIEQEEQAAEALGERLKAGNDWWSEGFEN
jgi:hypothetical protein